ncbi:MAG: hypothetical protein Q8R66_09475 [Methanobacteriaceae archaeon]|nr:hypothetical protein [Methanobacteriaceae archaeon]
MEKKYSSLIILIIVIGVIIGGYYLYKQNSDDDFYDNYSLQNNATYNATEQSNVILAMILSSMISSKSNSTINIHLESAKKNITKSLNYDQNMVKSAKTDSQKKYAQLLILQTQGMVKYIDLLDEINIAAQKDQNKLDGLMKQLDELRNQTKNYQEQLENIKNNDSELKKRINEEDKKSAN